MPEFKRKPIEGVFPLTPLALKENQEIDYDGIKSNIELLEEKGIPGFVQFGCMGQMFAPSEDEFNKVCNVCVNTAKGKKIAAVVSSTAPSTREVIRRIKYAEDAGADGSMIALPYAFPVTEKQAAKFYQEVVAAIKGELSIMAYNIPSLNRCNISPDLWKEHLLNIGSIGAVKESNFEMQHFGEVLLAIADKVNVFVSDHVFWLSSFLGAKGIIGILAWVAPRTIIKYYEECRKGNQQDSWVRGVYKAASHARAVMKRPGMPPFDSYEHAYLNALVEIGGGKAGPPRKPYEPLPSEAQQIVEEAVRPLVEMERKLVRA